MFHHSRDGRSCRRLSHEEFEARLCLSDVSFATHEIAVSDDFLASSIFAHDLDGDGDIDVILSSYDGQIEWHENLDGDGGLGQPKVIATAGDRADDSPSVHAADIDGDGDVDVLSANSSGMVAWYENTDGQGGFGPPNVITTDARAPRPSVHAADVDGDADIDVLSASFFIDKTAWYENTNGRGEFGPENIIGVSTQPTGFWGNYVEVADVDDDGDADILSATSSGHMGGVGNILWYRNLDGDGSFGPANVIGRDTDGAAYPADVDGDGDVDIVSASYNRGIGWYENTDGDGSFGPRKVISTDGPATLVYVADVDNDGDMDVLAATALFAEWRRVAWFENTDGRGSSWRQQPVSPPGTAGYLLLVVDLGGGLELPDTPTA